MRAVGLCAIESLQPHQQEVPKSVATWQQAIGMRTGPCLHIQAPLIDSSTASERWATLIICNDPAGVAAIGAHSTISLIR